jgi:16S rRNA processing protein RimM
MPRPEWIEVGRVKRAHGVRGEVRVLPSTDNPERFAPGEVLYGLLPGGGERRLLEVEDVRGTWDSMIVAFVGLEAREDADALRGCILQVPAGALPELGTEEYYPFDLEGLDVRSTVSYATVGIVQELLESPAHELLAILLSGGSEVLVPFTFEAVPEVRIDEGYVVVEDRFLHGPDEREDDVQRETGRAE